MKNVEYCTNDEWITDGMIISENIWDREISNEYINEALFFLENDNRAKDLKLVRARGQRILYHPWNGAHFTFRAGIFGSFSKLTLEEEDVLYDANNIGKDKAIELINKLGEKRED